MSCALSPVGLAEQDARFTRLGRHALWAGRSHGELRVILDADVREEAVQEALRVERGCCPFFALIWDADTHQLTVAARPEHEPVLERVATALALDHVLPA